MRLVETSQRDVDLRQAFQPYGKLLLGRDHDDRTPFDFRNRHHFIRGRIAISLITYNYTPAFLDCQTHSRLLQKVHKMWINLCITCVKFPHYPHTYGRWNPPSKKARDPSQASSCFVMKFLLRRDSRSRTLRKLGAAREFSTIRPQLRTHGYPQARARGVRGAYWLALSHLRSDCCILRSFPALWVLENLPSPWSSYVSSYYSLTRYLLLSLSSGGASVLGSAVVVQPLEILLFFSRNGLDNEGES